jgi:hypothetical protein
LYCVFQLHLASYLNSLFKIDVDTLDVEDIEEELGLPGDLINLGIQAKRELLVFKRSHNERDWEEEILRRIDSLGKSKDYDRLKRMAVSAAADTDANAPNTDGRGTKKGKLQQPPPVQAAVVCSHNLICTSDIHKKKICFHRLLRSVDALLLKLQVVVTTIARMTLNQLLPLGSDQRVRLLAKQQRKLPMPVTVTTQ